MRPETIQIFLPAGDPRGMRVVATTMRTLRVTEVLRGQLARSHKIPKHK